MKKRSQCLRILDLFRKQGYTTIRQASRLDINNPYARIDELRDLPDLTIDDIQVKRKGIKFKIYYTQKSRALQYMREIGAELI